MKKLSLFVLSVIFFHQLHAYPITPRPLRKLVIESDCIIQAYVIELGTEKVKKEKKKKRFDYDAVKSYALLLVREVWQGKINIDTLKIYYPAGLICPAPPRFEEHTEIIAFLDQADDGFSVHALSYGVKTFFQKDGVTSYKDRILEMQKILQQKDSKEKYNTTIEWLVTCAENPHTRWEGIYELSPTSDFMSYYDQDNDSPKGIYISSEHRQRLFTALLATANPGYEELGLVDLCKGIDDTRLLTFLKNTLIKKDEENLWVAGYFMQKILQFITNEEMEKISEEFDKYYGHTKEEKERKKQLLKEFIEKMKSAEQKPALFSSGNLSV